MPDFSTAGPQNCDEQTQARRHTISGSIDFSRINRRALSRLPDLLRRWLPGGRMEGREYVVKNPLRNDQSPGSFSINTDTGHWADFIPGGPSGGDSIALYAYLHGLKNGEAARRLAAELGLETGDAVVNEVSIRAPTDKTVTPIIPVPEDASPFSWRHRVHGEPVALWPYHCADGRLAGYAARVEWIEGGETKKDVYPITWCRIDDADGYYFGWRAKGVPQPRPLYRLPELLSDPNAPVVVCEGEKKADRVPALFPGHVGTTSMGGSKAPDKTDWSPLAGRNVTIWPDHDEAGQAYANNVARLATEAGAISVYVVDVPQGWPKAWDLADELPDGVDAEDLVELLRSARMWEPAQPAAADSAVATAAGQDDSDAELNSIQLDITKLTGGDYTSVARILERIASAELPTLVENRLIADVKRISGIKPASAVDKALKDAKAKLKAQSREVARPAASWSALVKRYEDTDEIRPMMANVAIILRNSPEFRDALCHNEFSDTVMVRRPLPWDDESIFKERSWDDADEIRLTEWLQSADDFVNVPPHVVYQGVSAVASEQRYHPVRNYLDSLVWDGVPRIDQLLPRYFGSDREDPNYLFAIGSRALIQAVARIYRPGIKADCCLLLDGDQGIKKSAGLRMLFDPLEKGWFTDELEDLSSKDAKVQLRGKWCVEFGELAGLRSADCRRSKAFLSRTTDWYHPPFGRKPIDVPRQCVFVGTSNDDESLRDTTGNRRYWPAWCNRIDTNALWEDRHQLWAEAVHRYRAGDRWWIDRYAEPELYQAAEAAQSDRQETDAWDSEIAKWLDRLAPETIKRGIATGDVLAGALCITDRDKWSRASQMRAADSLRRLGWRLDPKQKRRNGAIVRLYYPPPKVVTDGVVTVKITKPPMISAS